MRTDFSLVMMTGERHLAYLRQCLASMCHHWSELPPLILVGDGSVSVRMLEDAVRFYGAPVRAIDYAELRRRAQAEGHVELVEYGDQHVLGRKLLAILSLASSDQPVLWCDSDFLWFRPLSEESIAALRNVPIAMTEDCCCAYDRNIVQLATSLSAEPPFFNSGLVLVSRDLRHDPLVRDLASAAAQSAAWHTEQTVLGALAARYGAPAWRKHEVYITLPDHRPLRLSPSYRGQAWLGRHYVMAREQFWRDAAGLCRQYAKS